MSAKLPSPVARKRPMLYDSGSELKDRINPRSGGLQVRFAKKLAEQADRVLVFDYGTSAEFRLMLRSKCLAKKRLQQILK